MASSIITIVIGLLIAFVAPDWVKFGGKDSRSFVQLVFNVVGIVIALSGIVNLVRYFGNM